MASRWAVTHQSPAQHYLKLFLLCQQRLSRSSHAQHDSAPVPPVQGKYLSTSTSFALTKGALLRT